MCASCVQSTNTFFERQKTLVDLSTFHTPLTIVTLAVSCALRTRKIDEQELALRLATTSRLHLELTDGV